MTYSESIALWVSSCFSLAAVLISLWNGYMKNKSLSFLKRQVLYSIIMNRLLEVVKKSEDFKTYYEMLLGEFGESEDKEELHSQRESIRNDINEDMGSLCIMDSTLHGVSSSWRKLQDEEDSHAVSVDVISSAPKRELKCANFNKNYDSFIKSIREYIGMIIE